MSTRDYDYAPTRHYLKTQKVSYTPNQAATDTWLHRHSLMEPAQDAKLLGFLIATLGLAAGCALGVFAYWLAGKLFGF